MTEINKRLYYIKYILYNKMYEIIGKKISYMCTFKK